MTIEQRKISLINWISNLEDEKIIDRIEGFRSDSINELPDEIVTLLDISDATKEEICIEHTTSRDLLDK